MRNCLTLQVNNIIIAIFAGHKIRGTSTMIYQKRIPEYLLLTVEGASHLIWSLEDQGVELCDLSFLGRQINQHQLECMDCELEQGTSAYLCIVKSFQNYIITYHGKKYRPATSNNNLTNQIRKIKVSRWHTWNRSCHEVWNLRVESQTNILQLVSRP